MTARPPFRRRAVAPTAAAEVTAPAPASPGETTPPPAEPAGAPTPRAARRAVDPGQIPDVAPPRAADVTLPAGLAELDALAHGGVDMAALLGASPRRRAGPAPGEAVQGTVVRVTSDTVHVDLGARAEAFLPRKEAPAARPGDVVRAFVVDVDDLGVHLSSRLSGESAAVFLADAQEQGVPVEAKVESRSSGGFGVRIGPVRAFLPLGQASRLPLAQPDALVGQTIEVLVLETGDKVVVSRRAVEERALVEQRKARLAALAEGAHVDATVTSVQSWAVFLDVDGVELMLPRREAGWEDIADLTTRFDRGTVLRVRVSGRGQDDRVLVSLRDPALDPWLTAADRLPAGSALRGRVVGVTEFGVFVEVQPGLQGLVHRSRLAQVPPVGESLDVVVRSVDPARRRLELAATDPAWARAEAGPRAAPADEDDRAWRDAVKAQPQARMGTLADLLQGVRRRP